MKPKMKKALTELQVGSNLRSALDSLEDSTSKLAKMGLAQDAAELCVLAAKSLPPSPLLDWVKNALFGQAQTAVKKAPPESVQGILAQTNEANQWIGALIASDDGDKKAQEVEKAVAEVDRKVEEIEAKVDAAAAKAEAASARAMASAEAAGRHLDYAGRQMGKLEVGADAFGLRTEKKAEEKVEQVEEAVEDLANKAEAKAEETLQKVDAAVERAQALSQQAEDNLAFLASDTGAKGERAAAHAEAKAEAVVDSVEGAIDDAQARAKAIAAKLADAARLVGGGSDKWAGSGGGPAPSAPSTFALKSETAPSPQPASSRSSSTVFKGPSGPSLEERLMARVKEDRQVRVSCPSLEGTPHELLFRSMSATEGVSCLFEYKIDFVSKSPNVPLEKVVGYDISLSLEQPLPVLPDPARRFFNGYVSSFQFVGVEGEYCQYRAVLRPRLWLLTRNHDCRIFQDMSVPAVVLSILKDYGLSPEAENNALTGERFGGVFPPREYCVQYNESDFDFISRLMEEEGIHYFFRHSDGQHSIVLADSHTGHEGVEGYETIPFHLHDRRADRDVEAVTDWTMLQAVEADTYTVGDFDYFSPQTEGIVAPATSQTTRNHPRAGNFERYHYGEPVAKQKGHTWQTADGYAKLRAEEMHVPCEMLAGVTNARGLVAGSTFKLSGHPREAFNKLTYMVLFTHYEVHSGDYKTNVDSRQPLTYSCKFTAINAQHAFRPPHRTSKPLMSGPHSAVVTGPQNVEIYTDPEGLGRVLVKFHWDRYAHESKRGTSCWVRVSQAWAGGNFGSIQIPRVGEEVLVDFMGGDPDRPVIVGRLYNAKNKPPYKLPDNATQSGVKTRSTPDGQANNFNEIRFEDKKGKEELYVQAERDHNVFVKRNQGVTVGSNRSVTVHKNEEIAIKEERKTTVTKKDEQFYLDTRLIEVKKTDTLDVTELRTENYHGGRQTTVEVDDNTYVKDATQTISIDQQFNLSAQEHIGLTQKGNMMLIKDAVTIKSVGDIVITNDACTITMGKDGSMKMEGKQQVRIKSGAASITLTPDGSVTITGPLGTKMESGTNAVALSPAGVDVKGAMVNVSGLGSVTLMGPVIKVG